MTFGFLTLSYGQVYNAINYDTKDGLPSTEFYDVESDDKGFIWFTSDRGIVRYNGYEFETFSLENGLSNMVNFTFYKESESTFWVNGIDGSFTYWNGKIFIPFKFNDRIKQERSYTGQWFEIINTDAENIYYVDGNDPKTIVKSINKHNGQINIKKTDLIVCSSKCSNKTKRLLNYLNAYKKKVFNDAIALRYGYSFSSGKSVFLNKDVDKSYIYNEFVSDNDLYIMSDNGLSAYEVNSYHKKMDLIINASITSALLTESNELWATSKSKGIYRIPSLHIKKMPLEIDDINIDGLFSTKDKLYAKSVLGKVYEFDTNNQISSYYLQKNRGFYKGFENVNDPNEFFFGGVKYINNKPLLNDIKESNHVPIDSLNYMEYNYFELKYFTKNKLLFKKTIRALSIDLNDMDNIHIGTYNGLYSIDLHKTIQLDSFTREMRINDVKFNNNILWAGTLGNGIIYKIDNSWHSFDESILSTKSINSLFFQNDSTLWVGTNYGLNKINYEIKETELQIKSVNYYTASNGLSSNYIKDIVSFNDNIYVATDKGIYYFTSFKVHYSKPTIYFNKFQVGDDLIDVDSLDIRLDNTQNDIKLKYTGVSNNKPIGSKYFYRYALIDSDKMSIPKEDWNYTNNRELEFLNLNPGSYTFTIQCQNDNGLYSDSISKIFTIDPHFTQSSIFRSLLILLLLCMTLAVWKLRSSMLRKQMSLDLRIKNAELKTLRNQMNPHFIFNSINAVQNYIFSGKKSEANIYIHTLSKLIRKSLNFSGKETISLNEEIQFLQEYLLLEKMRFKNKFDFEINYDETLANDSLLIPSLISQPIVENAVKHAFKKADYTGFIRINFSVENSIVTVSIADNGIGISKNSTNSKHESLGLEIVKQRLDLLNEKNKNHKASIKIDGDSKPGTRIILTLPITR